MLMNRLLMPAIAAAMALPAMANAASDNFSPRQESMLSNLSPSLREYVVSRMGPEQRIPELIETTILNDLMEDYTDIRSLERVGTIYRAEVLKDGKWTVIDIDPLVYVVS